MTTVSRIILKLSAATSIAFGGWYLGKHSNTGDDKQNGVYSRLNRPLETMPGLPLFGSVSANVAFIGAEIDTEMGSKLSSNANRVSEIMRYGFPGLDHVRSYDDFVLSYDRRNRIAHWVFEHLNKERLQQKKDISRSNCEFKPDSSIHPYFRSENSDYRGSGYDRGHLAAAGNHKCSQRHMDQTFLLTNMAPQVGAGFNRDSWNRLEKHVRKLTKIYKEVYVCTGPLYLPKKEADGKKYVRYEVIGSNHVAVPTHFYKIVVCETHDNKLEMEAFVMPNAPIDDNTPLTNFQVPPESVERAAGLLFFDKISRDKLSKINGKQVQ